MPNKNILVCDDEEGIRESFKLILEDKYGLIFAENGMQCLDSLKQRQDINLVLLDIKMPRINGIEILKEIKKIRPEAKVIMVSGYKSVETAAEASHFGADDYITKPFDKQNILQTVAKIVG